MSGRLSSDGINALGVLYREGAVTKPVPWVRLHASIGEQSLVPLIEAGLVEEHDPDSPNPGYSLTAAGKVAAAGIEATR